MTRCGSRTPPRDSASKSLFDNIVSADRVTLVGHAADGFPMYGPYGNVGGAIRKLRSSYRLRDAARPDAVPGGYHYVLTDDFPFIPRAWRGTPNASFGHPSPGRDAVPPALRGYRGT